MLETRTKFNIRSPSKDNTINPGEFQSWSNEHMYRTSYHDMSGKVFNPLP